MHTRCLEIIGTQYKLNYTFVDYQSLLFERQHLIYKISFIFLRDILRR